MQEIPRIKAREQAEDLYNDRKNHIENTLQAYHDKFDKHFKKKVGGILAGCEPFEMFDNRGALAEKAACKALGIRYPQYHIPSLRHKTLPELSYLIVQDRVTGHIQLQHLDGQIISEKF